MNGNKWIDWIEAEKAGADSGVKDLKLPPRGGMVGIVLTARITNGAGGSATHKLRDVLTKIAVNDSMGNELFVMSAADALALATIRDREEPVYSEGTGAAAVQSIKVPIMFGTLGNGAYGIALSKLNGPRIQVEYSATVSGADGFVTKSLEFDVDILGSMGGTEPYYSGYIRSRYAVQTTSKPGDEDYELLASDKILTLVGYAYKGGVADGSLITQSILHLGEVDQAMIDQEWLDLQASRQPLIGSYPAYYAPLLMSPGRFNQTGFLAGLGVAKAILRLKASTDAGTVRVIEERLAVQ